MHVGGLCDDLGLAQYAFFMEMEMDEDDAEAVASSELAGVRGRSEIDPSAPLSVSCVVQDLESEASRQPASLVMLPRCVNNGTCPYLHTAPQLQSMLNSNRAQVSSVFDGLLATIDMDCSRQSTMQDKVSPRGPSSCDASSLSEDDEIAWARATLLDCKHLKRIASTECKQ